MLLTREAILTAIGDFLVVQDELRPADLIHITSGADRRADYGIQLYGQGYADRIFFTGWRHGDPEGNYAERGYARAIELGVPIEAIALDPLEVTSTFSEAVRLRLFIESQQPPVRSVIAVSDPHHMRRVQWSYRQVLGNAVRIQMAPVPFEMSPYPRRWWTQEESRQFVWKEYCKLVYYVARYRLSWGPLREWLASFDRE